MIVFLFVRFQIDVHSYHFVIIWMPELDVFFVAFTKHKNGKTNFNSKCNGFGPEKKTTRRSRRQFVFIFLVQKLTNASIQTAQTSCDGLSHEF